MTKLVVTTAAAGGLLALALSGCAAGVSGATGVEETASEGGSDTNVDGVYKFGQTVKYDGGSALRCDAPKPFRASSTAVGGEKAKTAVQITCRFTNGSKKVFNPTLTTTSISSGEDAGEEIFDSARNLGGAPTTKVLPGKSIRWTQAYGVNSRKAVTLTVTIGFLDFEDVTFTNEA